MSSNVTIVAIWNEPLNAELHKQSIGTSFIEKFFKVAKIYLKNRKIDILIFMTLFSFYDGTESVIQ